jgi:hypothetical protein
MQLVTAWCFSARHLADLNRNLLYDSEDAVHDYFIPSAEGLWSKTSPLMNTDNTDLYRLISVISGDQW